MGFHCAACGRYHDNFPMDASFREPLPYLSLTEERRQRAELTPDTCTFEDNDGKHCFVRGVLLLPVHDYPEGERFAWGVWVSLSERSFAEYKALGDAPLPEDHGWFGWLCNRLPHYPDTFLLKTNVYPQSGGDRPHIEVQACDHPLYREQRDGVTLARVHEFVDELLEG